MNEPNPNPHPAPKCPECETDLVLVNGQLPEQCAKCGFVLAGWPEFSRWIKAAQKQGLIPEKAKEPDPIVEPVSKNPLNRLRPRRR